MDYSAEFAYCKGIGCSLCERCIRYKEGLTLPQGDWKWMYDCGEDHDSYLPVAGESI